MNLSIRKISAKGESRVVSWVERKGVDCRAI